MKITKLKLLVIAVITSISLVACNHKETKTNTELAIANPQPQVQQPKEQLSKAFKSYWYNGEAEITSYKLEQARYGEMRDGEAVLIFVTEDFLPEVQVKADQYSKTNIPVLKLNATKTFNTGIYPYNIMQSTFYPVANNQHAIKVSASIQEWCGHVYAQLNNRDKFQMTSHSYFQSEADEAFSLEKTWTENELWTRLRINPKSLPTGNISIIPSLEFTRLKHVDIKAYQAKASLKDGHYTIAYSNINRGLTIKFNTAFPYDILGWEETFNSRGKSLTTKATKLKTLKTAYWGKNANADETLRDTLQLSQ